jgi:PAS domain S-box-containing protein
MRVPPSGSAIAALDDADLLVLAGEFHAAPDLFDGLAEGIALYRCDGSIVTGNRASRRMVGRTAQELVGRHFSIHIAPSERERVAAHHRQLIETEEPVAFETKFIHADGSSIDAAVRLLPARSRGRLVGVLGIAQDLTAQRRMERALERARECFQSFFAGHPDPVALIGADGLFVSVNRAAEAALGYATGELAGEPALLILAAGSAPEFTRALARALAGESSAFAIATHTRDGELRRFEVTAIPMVAGGANEGMFCIAREATVRLR